MPAVELPAEWDLAQPPAPAGLPPDWEATAAPAAPAPRRLPDHPLVAAAQRVAEAWQVPDVGSEVLERGGSPLLATLAQTGQTFGQRVFSPLAALPPVLTAPLLKARHPGEVIGETSPLAGAVAEALYEGGVRPLSSPIGILGLLRAATSFRRPTGSPVAEGLETGESLSTLAQKMRPFIPQPEDEVGPRPMLSKAPAPGEVSAPAPVYDPTLLARVEYDVRAGQAGQRLFIEEPGEPGPRRVIGEPSSFPEYFQNKGLTKKGVLKVVAKVKAGKRLTEQQHAVLTDLMEGAGKDLAMEQRAMPKPAEGLQRSPAARAAEAEFLRPTPPELSVEPGGLGMTIIPGARTFVEQDILPAARATGRGLREVLTGAAKIIAPRAFAPREGVDLLGAMRGTQEKANFLLDVDMASKNMERMFGAMPNHEAVAFIDRYKTGASQPTPVLQAAADFLRDIDGRLYRAKQAYRPSLAWKDNHLRVWWKTIPGAPPDVTGPLGVGRRPLEGTKGSLKRSTLPDMSEGLARGGEPVTYNPWTLFKMSLADDLKFISAQKFWERGQAMGLIKFVKRGQRPPDGFARVHDPIARVYFHTEKGLVNPGEYFVEEGLGRLINHHLSRDWVRDSAAGWGLMQLKNLETQIELGLSGFHAVFETGESISSGMAMGLRRIFNLGARGRPSEVVRGLGEMVSSPTAPAALARLGGQFFRVASGAEEFVKMTHTEDFRRAFPTFDQMVDDLTAGGARLTMREPWRRNSIKTFQEALHANNELGAMVRAPLALNETLMIPLFDWYIPRLKVGLFLREFSLRLRELEPDLARGQVTRPQVARQVWDFVEDRLGEMNFDNLYWNQAAKGAMQLLFRSITWKLGTLRGVLGAVPEQAVNIAQAIKGETALRLEPKMAWLATLSMTTAGLAMTIQKMMTGESPKDVRDLVYPRVDPTDERIRVSLPTYLRDILSLKHSPWQYVRSSMSATASRLFEAWANQDFYGVQVYDPNDPITVRAANILGHFFVLPFSVQSFNRMRQEGQPGWLAASGAVGLTRAPVYISRTRAEEMAAHLVGRKVSGLSRTREEADHAGIKKRVLAAFRAGRQPAPEDMQAIVEGRLSPQEVGRLTGRARFMPLQDMFRRLSLSEAARVFQAATPREREEVQPILLAKMRLLQALPPSQQAEVMRTIEPLIQEPAARAAVPEAAAVP